MRRGSVHDSTSRQRQLIDALLDERAYPHDVQSIELLETHISWVLLTGRFAYKIKKAIKLEFLDFSTLEQRKFYCDEELRLNRRWAPRVYLDVVPIAERGGRPRLGDNDDNVIEHALKMRQFPQSARLDNQLEAGKLDYADMRALAETIAAYHDAAPRIGFESAAVAIAQISGPVAENYPPIRPLADRRDLDRIESWTGQQLDALQTDFVERHERGFVRECHGDLHLANLVRLDEGIVPFDCVEFSPALRNIDVLSDIAFLFMDLVARERSDLAYTLINRYLECTGDYAGMGIFGLYVVYHCMIRAKVAAIRHEERDEDAGRAHDMAELGHYIDEALRWIERPRPTLIAMHGFSGSGKTWLSSRLMTALPAVRIRSDVERKRNLDLDETASTDSEPGAGAYTVSARRSIYQRLMELAEGLLATGVNVIIDASFLARADRDLAAALAGRAGTAFVVVDTTAARDVLSKRLTDRAAAPGDASEADVGILDYQADTADEFDADESYRTLHVTTDADIKIRTLAAQILDMSARIGPGK